jgi:hypothetical protein
MAGVVGEKGRLIAIECDDDGAVRVKDNLAHMLFVEARSFEWFIGIIGMLCVFSSCMLSSHQPAAHISVKAVSWKLVKKNAEPEAGLVGNRITIIDSSDGRVVAEKLTDDLGYAIFDIPAGSYTVMGIGGEPQRVVVSPGQTVEFKLIVH